MLSAFIHKNIRTGIIGLLGLLCFLQFFCSEKKQRKNPPEFAARILIEQNIIETLEGDRFPVKLELKNTGRGEWPGSGPERCLISYHLFDSDNQLIRFDNPRHPLPGAILPGQTKKIELVLRSPLHAGRYRLQFDLLREGIAWFQDGGSPTTDISLQVSEKRWRDIPESFQTGFGEYSYFVSDLEEINFLYKLIRITLEKNQVEFQLPSGKIRGFSPGSDYPQIWLRDANTILPAAQLFYPADYLKSWLEEHLKRQSPNGALQDWFDSQGKSGKNTTETDQEAGAVQSAYQVYILLGPDWLRSNIGGKSVLTRLESALGFVLKERFDQSTGMIIGAHTADWGDVDISDSDERAVDTDENTVWTVDIYDQSMFYFSCILMAEMLAVMEEHEKSGFWLQTARSIRDNTRKLLWQSEKGFFRIHHHLAELEHDFDEADIFALGGNTIAALSRLADQEQSRKIIQTALDRQAQHRVSTISGTLLPPYPEKTYSHPLMDSPFEYQNGAQWDWFGGRMITAMFRFGFSAAAKEKLLEIIRKNQRNGGFFEWDDREGTAVGSDYFCGSAGVLAQAVIEGYFGILRSVHGLNLQIRLAQDSAGIHLYYPSDRKFIAYEYKFDPVENKISMTFESRCTVHGDIKILSPWGHPAEAEDPALTVFIDGKKIDYHIEKIQQDTYIRISAAYPFRRLEIERE